MAASVSWVCPEQSTHDDEDHDEDEDRDEDQDQDEVQDEDHEHLAGLHEAERLDEERSSTQSQGRPLSSI